MKALEHGVGASLSLSQLHPSLIHNLLHHSFCMRKWHFLSFSVFNFYLLSHLPENHRVVKAKGSGPLYELISVNPASNALLLNVLSQHLHHPVGLLRPFYQDPNQVEPVIAGEIRGKDRQDDQGDRHNSDEHEVQAVL
jgi:hypothetical protein